MKANVKRPARFSFKTITEKKAKHLTLIFVAVLFLVIVVLALFPLLDREEERYEVTTYAMGSYVQQTVYGENREDAAVKAADAVEALEQKISWRVANSDIQKLNNNAGKDWVTLSDETLNILTQAQSVSEKSGGAFDVTIAPISRRGVARGINFIKLLLHLVHTRQKRGVLQNLVLLRGRFGLILVPF